MMRLLLSLLALVAPLVAEPKRVLFFSHTAGFRHESILTAREVLRTLDPERWRVTASEDLAMIAAERLREFHAVFFFTSGELALSDAQKRELLEYVRGGGGFGASHSASDTFYTWPEYGELLGAYFDGHPWVQEVAIDVEDPDHPVTRGLPSSFRLVEEVYQHRALDRAKVRVLLTLDTRTVNLGAPGVNRTDGDFALAWVRSYGRGRVFYTALGHFDEVFRDARVQLLLRQALDWMTGLTPGDTVAETLPRGATEVPRVNAVVEAAQFGFAGVVSPGALVSLFGTNLTSGSTMAAAEAVRLAGTSVLLNGVALPVLYAAPGQVNVRLPDTLPVAPELVVRAGVVNSAPAALRAAAATPGIFAVTQEEGALVVWATGLGELDASGRTRLTPRVTRNGEELPLLYSGQAPGFPGLYQINTRANATPALTTRIRLEVGGAATEILRP